MTTFVSAEIASQPDVWRQAAAVASTSSDVLPAAGARVAVVGCGTSWFIAQSYAARRESLGLGETDAFVGSEFPAKRHYDLVIAITRSGTTTEILELLATQRGVNRTLAIVGDPNSPAVAAADACILLPFADERSVVQTRYATATLALLRSSLGEDMLPLADACEEVIAWEVPSQVLDRTQFTFLGRGWSVGLANEAGLKMREASIAWSESYPAMDYRHGPISITDTSSLVVFLGPAPEGLASEARTVGALVLEFDEDPMLTLVRCQKIAIANAAHKGIDPDHPRHLTRSIILDR